MNNKKVIIIIAVIFGISFILGFVGFVLGIKNTKQKNKGTDQKTEITEVSTELKFDKEGLSEDPFMDKNGPFYHKVYKATSTDGVTFTKTGELIMDKSSVPDVVKMNDGTLYIYAVDGAQRSNSGIMVARSKDNGKTWEQGSLNVKTSRTKFSVGADPQAVLLPDGSIRLYYLVFPDKKPPLDSTGKPIPTGEKNYIKSAVSTDGVNFTEEEGSRFEMTQIWTDPDVIKIDPSTGSGQGKWFMYLSEGSKNIATTSDDGMTFTLGDAVRNDGAISKTVPVGDRKYRQFYCKAGISSAVTTDGINFTGEVVSLKDDGNEILCDPTPVKISDGNWLMFYKSAPIPTNGPKQVQPLQ